MYAFELTSEAIDLRRVELREEGEADTVKEGESAISSFTRGTHSRWTHGIVARKRMTPYTAAAIRGSICARRSSLCADDMLVRTVGCRGMYRRDVKSRSRHQHSTLRGSRNQIRGRASRLPANPNGRRSLLLHYSRLVLHYSSPSCCSPICRTA